MLHKENLDQIIRAFTRYRDRAREDIIREQRRRESNEQDQN